MSDVWLSLLALHVLKVVVNEPLQVEEGSDAVDVGADGPEVAVPVGAGPCTEVAQEELAKHLLAAHTGAQTPGPPPGPGAGGGDQQGHHHQARHHHGGGGGEEGGHSTLSALYNVVI